MRLMLFFYKSPVSLEVTRNSQGSVIILEAHYLHERLKTHSEPVCSCMIWCTQCFGCRRISITCSAAASDHCCSRHSVSVPVIPLPANISPVHARTTLIYSILQWMSGDRLHREIPICHLHSSRYKLNIQLVITCTFIMELGDLL